MMQVRHPSESWDLKRPIPADRTSLIHSASPCPGGPSPAPLRSNHQPHPFTKPIATMTAPTTAPPLTLPLTWPDLTSRPRPAGAIPFSYGADSLQQADLWLPAGHGPFPVVLMVHGGCWQTHIADRKLMDWVADDLRQHGIAVWNIDYRGVDRAGGGYPGTFADAAAAADQLRTVAPRHGLDLSRLVAVGHSAGGHLALWLAARPRPGSTAPIRSRSRR
jgi:acetyl esterase/lipase